MIIGTVNQSPLSNLIQKALTLVRDQRNKDILNIILIHLEQKFNSSSVNISRRIINDAFVDIQKNDFDDYELENAHLDIIVNRMSVMISSCIYILKECAGYEHAIIKSLEKILGQVHDLHEDSSVYSRIEKSDVPDIADQQPLISFVKILCYNEGIIKQVVVSKSLIDSTCDGQLQLESLLEFENNKPVFKDIYFSGKDFDDIPTV